MFEIKDVDDVGFVDGKLVSILYKSDVSFGHATKTFQWDKIAFACHQHLRPAGENPAAFRFYVDSQGYLVIIQKETAHA